ncbi:MAG: family transposase [Variovorax sp.]|nr:family transposase [Variovorax sp.]
MSSHTWMLSTLYACGIRLRMDLTDARTVMGQMTAAFEHFNEVHPHSALKMKSPREFRQHRAAQQHLAQIEQTLHCEQPVS